MTDYPPAGKKAIVDVRIYTIRPRGIPQWLKIFEELGLPVLLKHLGPPVGYYYSEIGPLNQVTHIWEYDSLADMEAAARRAMPIRTGRNSSPRTMASSQPRKTASCAGPQPRR